MVQQDELLEELRLANLEIVHARIQASGNENVVQMQQMQLQPNIVQWKQNAQGQQVIQVQQNVELQQEQAQPPVVIGFWCKTHDSFLVLRRIVLSDYLPDFFTKLLKCFQAPANQQLRTLAMAANTPIKPDVRIDPAELKVVEKYFRPTSKGKLGSLLFQQ